MDLDPLLLSRIQFAFTVSFHILFPAFTIGLAAWIVVLEARWYITGRHIYFRLSEFWTKIFAISFGMGVVSGIVMSYQFGTNWSRFSDITGNILGPLIQYEVVTAFFLEATFLGILLFGRQRVSPGMHFFAACMVSLGTLLSSFWILSANSWMHTPAGFEFRDGRFFVADWFQAIFNPSFPYRFSHMVTATFLTTAFVVAGVSGWHLLKRRFIEHARIGFSMALGLITVLAPVQIILGDLHGLNTFKHQPLKIAAMEGNWDTASAAPLILFAIPDEQAETNHYEMSIPQLSSFILTHEMQGQVPTLKSFPPEDRPNVPVVFFAFRIMVGLGVVMLSMGLISLILRIRGRLYETRWFHRLAVACLPIGFIALLAGWFTTEVGRQPWVVHGLVRTAQAASPALTGTAVMSSLTIFIVVYALIFSAGTLYIVRVIRFGPKPPDDAVAPEAMREAKHSKRPLSVPEEGFGPAE
ncbi:MAG TPA: cytochrome ubiquinol oxidase subunit I [Azospirillaceae bacterium]|nr:cytochrome ubiquinol oxidase subunit I [Azospirillaceae bacterium]